MPPKVNSLYKLKHCQSLCYMKNMALKECMVLRQNIALSFASCYIYLEKSTQHIASKLIKHLALPHALLASQLQASCFISCKALTAML